MRILYRGPSKDPSYQVSIHLAKRFQKRTILKTLPIRNKNCVYGGHVYKRIGTKWAIFIEDLPMMLSTKFRFIWQSVFRGDEFFLEINQSETRIAYGGHVCQRIGTRWANFIEDLQMMLPTKFWFIWQSVFFLVFF